MTKYLNTIGSKKEYKRGVIMVKHKNPHHWGAFVIAGIVVVIGLILALAGVSQSGVSLAVTLWI